MQLTSKQQSMDVSLTQFPHRQGYKKNSKHVALASTPSDARYWGANIGNFIALVNELKN